MQKSETLPTLCPTAGRTNGLCPTVEGTDHARRMKRRTFPNSNQGFRGGMSNEHKYGYIPEQVFICHILELSRALGFRHYKVHSAQATGYKYNCAHSALSYQTLPMKSQLALNPFHMSALSPRKEK